ncbi:MAG: FAD-dependent oxidoreductase [Bdellovibrionota bacterium]
MAPPPLLKWRVVARNQLAHDVFELRIARPEGMTFRAGQYMSIVIPGAGPGGRNLRRAYSIASTPEWEEIELCVKKVDGGPGTSYLDTLKAGDEFQAQAPFGDFYLEHDQSLPTLFVGTGTGLAPLRSMVLSKEWTGTGPLGFLLGVREARDIIYPELFGVDRPAPLRQKEHVQIALSRADDTWKGFRGRVTDYIRNMSWDFAKSHYYLCGNGDMISEVKDYLMNSKGVTKEQIHTEKYY